MAVSQLVSDIVTAIQDVYSDAPIMQCLCIAQAILESNLLQNPSGLAINDKNLFGIKGTGTAGSVNLETSEYVNGQWVRVPQPFAKNLTYEDSIRQHRHVMSLLRYSEVWKACDLQSAATEVWKGGYATDPHYPKELIVAYNNYLTLTQN